LGRARADLGQPVNVERRHGARRAGGVLFAGALPGVVFSGNRVRGNGWDQVLVAAHPMGRSPPLDLRGGSGPSDCGSALTNQFCPDPARGGVGVYSLGAAIDARFNAWSNAPPVQDTDFGGWRVDWGARRGAYCAAVDETCEPAVCPR